MKLNNLTIRDAYLAAEQLTQAPLDFELALALYDAVEALGPAFRAQDSERAKLVGKYKLTGLDDASLNASPNLNPFLADYTRLLEIEREVPDIAPVEVRPGDLAGVKVTGQQIGALRRSGVLRVVSDEAGQAA